MTPDRLDHAERMLTGDGPDGHWPRCSVWLGRTALERAVRQVWLDRHPGVEIHEMRTLLLAVATIVDGGTLRRVGALWDALSRAGHHHHYELTPTAAEIRTWLVEARLLVAALEYRR